MECMELRVKDIDFESNQIIISDGQRKRQDYISAPQKSKNPWFSI